jgi:hypothetical protein
MKSTKKIFIATLAIPFLILFSSCVGAFVYLISGSAIFSILFTIAFFFWFLKDMDLNEDNEDNEDKVHKVHKVHKSNVLGIICVAIAVFGWTGYWFAGTGFAALIALGFLVTGISLISSNKE